MSEEEEEVQEAAPVKREVLSWKERALKLYESRQIAREQQAKVNFGKVLDQFREGLAQLLGKEYEVTDLREELDGVVFVGVSGSGPGASIEVHVEYKCPDCGAALTQLVRGIADIGGILSGAGEPHEDCPAKRKAGSAVKELTAGEKLIEAFREFLASELEEVED
ncbi:MAG: hypothetical protein P4L33_02545 [Capsulimonadaceae bacterium]|nr:hypothetical protein [Capsulimonadaceae bacterium]